MDNYVVGIAFLIFFFVNIRFKFLNPTCFRTFTLYVLQFKGRLGFRCMLYELLVRSACGV